MPFQQKIKDLVAHSGADFVAVGFYDLSNDEEFFILPDEPFHAASTMKICVLVELFRRADLGDLSLDELIAIRNEFQSIVDGSPYSLSEEDDSEPSLYERIGEMETLFGLARPMITHSCNLATNLLVDRLGAERITETMAEFGAPGLIVRRGVEDGKAYRLGLNNTATARGLTILMTKLAKGQVVSPAASKAMVDILTAQTHRNCIPTGLPEGTRAANKTGWNAGICHDTAIVFPSGSAPYVLTVLTRGLDEHTAGPALITEISRLAFAQR